MKRQEELFEILSTSAWFMDLLSAASAVNPPEWWIGAGAVRDLVWDIRFGPVMSPEAPPASEASD